ncbi:MAG: SDR family NAD(P)-dependent oxidoreductase [Flavobacteriaceae bacterium]
MSKQKNILIIGGSAGIGGALTKLLAAEHQVYVASRNPEQLTGVDYTPIVLDVTQQTISLDSLPATLEGFVYCPGSINLRPFKGLKEETFQEDFNINVLGAIRNLQVVAPLLQAAENASVVFFSTVAVQTGMPFHASIAAAKGALEGLTRSLAAEWAPKVRVNTIAPSLVDTPLAEKFLNNETKMAKVNERHPLKRVGKAEELAKAAAYLLNNDSQWMSGTILQLDGGIGNLKI